MLKVIKFLEYMWFIVAIVGLVFGVYFYVTGKTEDALYFLLMTVLGTVLYMLRRRQRKNLEKDKPSGS